MMHKPSTTWIELILLLSRHNIVMSIRIISDQKTWPGEILLDNMSMPSTLPG
jgi:hypothetical protein